MKTLIKKQLILFTLILAMSFGVSGCLKQSETNNNEKPTKPKDNINNNQLGDKKKLPNRLTDLSSLPLKNLPIDDWLIYKNDMYGFEFKYPKKIDDIKFWFSEHDDVLYMHENGIFEVSFRPLIYQDSMMNVVVLRKGIVDLLPEMLPLKLRQDYKLYEVKFEIADQIVNGYKYNLIINENIVLINDIMIVKGENYDYYITTGYERNIKYCDEEKNLLCYKIVEKALETFRIF